MLSLKIYGIPFVEFVLAKYNPTSDQPVGQRTDGPRLERSDYAAILLRPKTWRKIAGLVVNQSSGCEPTLRNVSKLLKGT